MVHFSFDHIIVDSVGKRLELPFTERNVWPSTDSQLTLVPVAARKFTGKTMVM